MKKFVFYGLLLASLFSGQTLQAGGRGQDDNRVVIYSSLEDFRNEYLQQRLDETFPGYKVVISYLPSGNNAAKLRAEGVKTECDIVMALDRGYLEGLVDMLADLSSYDSSSFLDELVPPHHKYLPWDRFGGCIAVNAEILRGKGLPVPDSYDDLLNPIYKGLVSMPNPKSSATGYMFVKSLINARGEDAAFAYFDKLSENIFQFTSSGSGPTNALVQGEAGIGIGMTFHVVTVNNNGANLDILFFKEGAPYSTNGVAIIKGKENRIAVKNVFGFIVGTVLFEDKERFSPEQILKEQTISLPNFPRTILYADMTGIEDLVEKQRILDKWTH
jgi:iron(III) transport system substrate-binding protein